MRPPSIPSSIPYPLLLSLLLASLITTSTTALETTVIVTITATKIATETSTATAAANPLFPQDPSYISTPIFKSTVLSVSDAYRTIHNASHLIWNDTLAQYAESWAETCKWEHSHGPYGENLAYGYTNASAAIRAWGDEYRFYDFDKPTGFSEETGHFTQLVWKGTREVGCAVVDCGWDPDDDDEKRAKGWYVVCEYVPPGNVVGSGKKEGVDDKEWFRVNVQKGDGELDFGSGDDNDDDGRDDDTGDGGGIWTIPTGGGDVGGLVWRIRCLGWWVGMVLYVGRFV